MYPVCKPTTEKPVRRGRHQAGVRISRTPADKWASRVLLRGLKRRLEKAKGAWAEEVPRIVWAYHTTPQSATMETPFSLVYGSDAMIPVEIHESSPRNQNVVAEESNEERRVNLDLPDEAREEARIKAEAVKRRVERQYSSKVKPRQFQRISYLPNGPDPSESPKPRGMVHTI